MSPRQDSLRTYVLVRYAGDFPATAKGIRNVPFLKEHCLVFANMPRTQAIWSAVEVASKIFNCMDVATI